MLSQSQGAAVQNDEDPNSNDQVSEDPLFEDHGQDLVLLMKKKNHLAGFVLLLGLGLHSFLAGLGFGAVTDTADAVSLAIAILAHKYLAAFALGCPFYKSGVPIIQHVMIGICFAVITPTGAAIGWAVSDS